MMDLKTIFSGGQVSVEQLGGGLDKLNFAVHSPEGFFIWQLSARPLDSERRVLLEKLAEHMESRGITTRHLVTPSVTKLSQSVFCWMAIYRGVSGQSIPWSDYSQQQIASAVKYLGKIHEAGRSFAGRNSFKRFGEEFDRWPAAVEPGYQVNQEILTQIKTRLAVLNRDQTAATVLHGDFGRANVIFRGDEVAGVVDFDRVSVGHPVFDLGRFTSYLLLDTSQPSADVISSVCRTYRSPAISAIDLRLATTWAWWTDWLSWRKSVSHLREKLKTKLITSKIIEPI